MQTWFRCARRAPLVGMVLVLAALAARAGPDTAGQLAERVRSTGDHGQRPFAIVDKRSARLMVFDADGRLAGQSAVLLGRAVGDHSEPGVGERTQLGTLRPGDATTPAGRFNSMPGRNLTGEAVVWVDRDAAFAIHRLREGASMRERARRLVSADPRDRRVSAGCVVVPTAFYDGVVQPVLGRHDGVVYVMPELEGKRALVSVTDPRVL